LTSGTFLPEEGLQSSQSIRIIPANGLLTEFLYQIQIVAFQVRVEEISSDIPLIVPKDFLTIVGAISIKHQ
jgi:hypothetical protein